MQSPCAAREHTHAPRIHRDNGLGAEGAAAVCGAAGGVVSACLGVQLAVARASLLAACPAASRLNCPNCSISLIDASILKGMPTTGSGGGEEQVARGGNAWLCAFLLAGGPVAGLPRDALRGLTTLYDEPYSHATDITALRAVADAVLCTHVVVAAGRAGDMGPLQVAAVGARVAVLGWTAGDETRVSHGTHWYCCEGKSFGFAPTGDVKLSSADSSHQDDPLRLSWHLDGRGGWRAGDVCSILGSDWRKFMWGFRLNH
jgi:hypothetical protein